MRLLALRCGFLFLPSSVSACSRVCLSFPCPRVRPATVLHLVLSPCLIASPVSTGLFFLLLLRCASTSARLLLLLAVFTCLLFVCLSTSGSTQPATHFTLCDVFSTSSVAFSLRLSCFLAQLILTAPSREKKEKRRQKALTSSLLFSFRRLCRSPSLLLLVPLPKRHAQLPSSTHKNRDVRGEAHIGTVVLNSGAAACSSSSLSLSSSSPSHFFVSSFLRRTCTPLSSTPFSTWFFSPRALGVPLIKSAVRVCVCVCARAPSDASQL